MPFLDIAFALCTCQVASFGKVDGYVFGTSSPDVLANLKQVRQLDFVFPTPPAVDQHQYLHHQSTPLHLRASQTHTFTEPNIL